MKRNLILLCTLLCINMTARAVQVWDGTSAEIWTKGGGTESDPYLIETPANLAYLSHILRETANSLTTHFAQAYYKQTDDFDLNGKEWSMIGGNTTAFSGTYDGGGHLISNPLIRGVLDPTAYLQCHNTSITYGIFGNCTNATFKYISIGGETKIICSTASAYYQYVSPLVAKAKKCTFIGCKNATIINIYVGAQSSDGCTSYYKNFLGGIAGCATECQFVNVQNEGTITYSYSTPSGYDNHIGGIVGYALNSTFENASNIGNIYITSVRTNAMAAVGGIVGFICSSDNKLNKLKDCYNRGTLSFYNLGYETSICCLGGLVGNQNGRCRIETSFSIGNIEAKSKYSSYGIQGYIGGILGYSGDKYVIIYCYARDNISVGQHGNTSILRIAGVIGYTYAYTTNDTIANSYVASSWNRSVPKDIYGAIYIPQLKKIAQINNVHYVSTIIADSIHGTAQTGEYMKSEDFVDLLNSNGNYFKMDTKNINDGYPILDCLSNYLLQVKANTGGIAKGSGNYQKNSQVTISAIPSESYAFTGWSDGSTENPRTITLLSDSTITASFRRTNYTIKVAQDCTITME